MTEEWDRLPGAEAEAEPAEGEDAEDEPRYAPPEQSILPGYKKYIAVPPKDWRRWEDGRGNKIDSPPAPRGPTFTGRVVPPLVGRDGQPIRMGSYQLIRNARGEYVLIDRSKTMDPDVVVDPEDEGITHALMGREMFKSRTLRDTKDVMIVLYARDRDAAAGLIPDPTPQRDLRGTLITFGSLLLCRYERGPSRGLYVVVNQNQPVTNLKREVSLKGARNLKQAVAAAEKKYNELLLAQKKRAEGKKMLEFAFDVPEGFGGGEAAGSSSGPAGAAGDGGASRRFFSDDRAYPLPGSMSWTTIAQYYGTHGRWCETAGLIWNVDGEEHPDKAFPPEEIIRECEEARREFLESVSAIEKEIPNVAEVLAEIPEGSRNVVLDVLEAFRGAVLTEFRP